MGIGFVDSVRGEVRGWAANPKDPSAVCIWIEVCRLNDDGAPTELVITTAAIEANLPREDLRSRPDVEGVNHGFSYSIRHLQNNPYIVRVTGFFASGNEFLYPFESRVYKHTLEGMVFWLQYFNTLDELKRADNYEMYPTAIRTPNGARLWFCGLGEGSMQSQGLDNIYHAESSTSTISGFTPSNSYRPILDKTLINSDLVANPSVVYVNGLYYMYVEGRTRFDGRMPAIDEPEENMVNRIFLLTSDDGVTNWTPHGSPVVTALQDTGERGGIYGVSDASIIYLPSDNLIGSFPSGFLMYYFDESAPMRRNNCRTCTAISTDGRTFHRVHAPLPNLGESSWDFKKLSNGNVLAFLAKESAGQRSGQIVITVSRDGEYFAEELKAFPMRALTADQTRQLVRAGGLLGNELGHIEGDETVFYFGAGGPPGKVLKWRGPSSGDGAEWDLIGVDPRAVSLATAESTVYLRMYDGEVMKWDGQPNQWRTVRRPDPPDSPGVLSLAADGSASYVLLTNGEVRRFPSPDADPDLVGQHIGHNAKIISLAAAGSALYVLFNDGEVMKWDGQPNQWHTVRRPDPPDSLGVLSLAAADSALYVLLTNGEVRRWREAKGDWVKIGENREIGLMAAAGSDLYLLLSKPWANSTKDLAALILTIDGLTHAASS